MNKIVEIKNIQNKIYLIRDVQVMLDSDLAELYDVSTKRLNEQVRRNTDRFPEDFMFKLTKEEWENFTSQDVISKNNSLRSQNATLNKTRGRHRKYLPYVFTEQGVSMLSTVLKSKVAVEVSVNIIRAFSNMRRFIANNAELFYRLNSLEQKQIYADIKINETNNKVDRILNALERKELIPKQGIFYNGQVFDAYLLITDIIKSAKKYILLIDNYPDETVLAMLDKRKKNVDAVIYTKKITKQLQTDIEKHNAQYPEIKLKKLTTAHDRFLIIDSKTVYHFGASLKDAGKKWFAFSKLEINAEDIIEKL